MGVLHRDVKPANILLDGDRAILTDFGIAAVASDTTLTDSVVGSPEYLAPERVNGAPASPAADLWSLGVTLCAALRGESPFRRSDTQATLAAVLTYEPPPIPRAPTLWPVLSAILHKDPDRRPSPAEVRTCLTGGPPANRQPTPHPKPAPHPDPTPHPGPTSHPEPAPGPDATPHPEPTPRPDSAPHPEPHPESPPRRRKPRPRFIAIAIAIAAVVALLVAGGIWFLTRSDDPPTVSAPPGYTAHQGDGFTIAAPRGWFKDSSDQSIHFVSDPHALSNVLAHVEWWDDGHPDGARGVLTGFERGDFTMDFITNYQRVRLDDTTAAEGASSAELEITYHVSMDGDEFDNHELIRAVVTASGRTYVLTIAAQTGTPATTEQLWQREKTTLTTILDSFRVTMP